MYLYQFLVCEAIESGIGVVFGPSHLDSSNIVQSMCERMEVPRIETSWESTPVENFNYYFNLYPEPTLLAKVQRTVTCKKICFNDMFILKGLYGYCSRYGLEVIHITLSTARMSSEVTGFDTRLFGENKTK